MHVSCAFLSLGGFALRGIWTMRGSALMNKPATKILPHIVDTMLLASAVAILLIWQLNPFAVNWLTAKIIALLLYILLGMVAFRFGRNRMQRACAFVLALFAGAYILVVAYSKTPYVFSSIW
ncbi:MAG: SirB2 family protein [Pseudomonadota bacterium]